jgi:hypothetical protein
MAETLRNSTAPSAVRGEDRVPIFWKVFGGTLVSIAALVVITLCQHFNASLTELRGDLQHLCTDLRKDLGRLSESYGELVKKDEFGTRLKSVWDSIKELQDGKAALLALKEKAALMDQQFQAGEAERKELVRELQRLRQAQAVEEDRKALVRELQRLRERLAVVEGRERVPHSSKSSVPGDE